VLAVVNEAQAETARKLMGIAPERIAVIPHLVDAEYFSCGQGSSEDNHGDYVLCTGNVCARKNQLRLAEAARTAECPLLIVGNVLEGEERYGDALARLCDREPGIRWLPAMPGGSAQLVAAYRAARVVALPSLEETQPISLLEAAAARKALVTSDLPFARQGHYRNAYLVRPRSISSIAAGLRAAMAAPERYTPPASAVQGCSGERVATGYRRVFERVVERAG
jgi:glycosyltransferase involved in cell wall biosynthesis